MNNNGSNHAHNPLLKPAEIQIATKLFPGPTPASEHRQLIRVKIILSLDADYSLHVWSSASTVVLLESELRATGKTV